MSLRTLNLSSVCRPPPSDVVVTSGPSVWPPVVPRDQGSAAHSGSSVVGRRAGVWPCTGAKSRVRCGGRCFVVSEWWRNERRENQSAAAVVAMVGVTMVLIGVGVATIVELRTIPEGSAFDADRDDLAGGLIVAVAGWALLMCLLVWVGFGRAADPDRYTRPIPPLGFMASAAIGLAGVAAVEEDGFAAMVIGAGAWCWVWGVLLVLADEGDDDVLEGTDDGDEWGPPVPRSRAEELPMDSRAGSPPKPVRPPGRHRKAPG